MSKTLRLVALFIIALLVLSACDLNNNLIGQTAPTPLFTLPPSQAPLPTADDSLLATQIAATVYYNLTLTAEANAILGTPTDTTTPEIPSGDTSTPTVTPTSTAKPTHTPSPVRLTVSIDNNCRAGPGKVYDSLAILKDDVEAIVVGKDTFNNYWIIKNPTTGKGKCWIWGRYATVTGSTSGLPEIPVPPTPTPTP